MFGYVTVNAQALSEEDEKRYRECYCGLCRELKERYGQLGRLTLTNDMTFLLVLLMGLYEPTEIRNSARCVAHPAKARAFTCCTLTAYAADMNVLLAYYKGLDDWQDERKRAGRMAANILARRVAAVEKKYPRQAEAIRTSLAELARLEAARTVYPDPPANAFGRLLGEIFVWHEDEWAPLLRQMGQMLGRFIYLCDAFEDVYEDEKKGRYNPLSGMAHEADFPARVRAILTMLIADCTAQFERLPIVQDAEIMRNVLYSGVWSKFEAVVRQRGGRGEGETK